MSSTNPKIKKVVSRFCPQYFVAPSVSNVYGDSIWEEEWEPDQQSAISKVLQKCDVNFVDVGAAIGIYSLMAGALGRHVIAFEPAKLIFQDLSANIECNEIFSQNVALYNGFVVSRKNLERRLGGYAQSRSSLEFSDSNFVLQKELAGINQFVMKMDIEGAEWPILQDEEFICFLRQSNFILFLSLHIGFHNFDYTNLTQKMRYRLGVVSEIFSLLKLRFRFKYFLELKNGKLVKVKFLRRNLFNGNGWHHFPIVISNSAQFVDTLR